MRGRWQGRGLARLPLRFLVPGLISVLVPVLVPVLIVAQSQPIAAQALSTGIVDPGIPILTLDQDRVFAGSRFGQRLQADFAAQTRDLATENRRIEAALEAEERDLTARRPGLPTAEFRALAEAFDAKVEAMRTTQDDKSRALSRLLDEERQRFYAAALPLLGEMMREVGAVAILNSDAIVLSFDRIDITDEAIAKLDAQLGDGAAPPAQPGDGAAPPAP